MTAPTAESNSAAPREDPRSLPRRDVREPKQQPLELILARNLVSIVSLAAFLVDVEGRIVFYNEATAEIIGSSFEETGTLTREE